MSNEKKGKKINLTDDQIKQIKELIKQTKYTLKKLEEEMRE